MLQNVTQKDNMIDFCFISALFVCLYYYLFKPPMNGSSGYLMSISGEMILITCDKVSKFQIKLKLKRF